jgi:very-short-patch-repair endonuclease
MLTAKDKRTLERYTAYQTATKIEKKWHREYLEYLVATGQYSEVLKFCDELDAMGRLKTIKRQMPGLSALLWTASFHVGGIENMSFLKPGTTKVKDKSLKYIAYNPRRRSEVSGRSLLLALSALKCDPLTFEASTNELVLGFDLLRVAFRVNELQSTSSVSGELNSCDIEPHRNSVSSKQLERQSEQRFNLAVGDLHKRMYTSNISLMENREKIIEDFGLNDNAINLHLHPMQVFFLSKFVVLQSFMIPSFPDAMMLKISEYLRSYPYNSLVPTSIEASVGHFGMSRAKFISIISQLPNSNRLEAARTVQAFSILEKFISKVRKKIKTDLSDLVTYTSKDLVTCIEIFMKCLFNGLHTKNLETSTTERLPSFFKPKLWVDFQPDFETIDVERDNYASNANCRALACAYLDGNFDGLFDALLFFTAARIKTPKIQIAESEIKELRDAAWALLETETYNPRYYVGSNNEVWLTVLVMKNFPNEQIIREFSPWFIQPRRVDLAMPNRRIVIEFDGPQHFKSVRHWGGVDKLIETALSDQYKETRFQQFGWKILRVRSADAETEQKILDFIARSPIVI